jgi:hypothetical protein
MRFTLRQNGHVVLGFDHVERENAILMMLQTEGDTDKMEIGQQMSCTDKQGEHYWLERVE